MADRDDYVPVPRKWINAFVSGVIMFAFWLLQHAYTRIDDNDKGHSRKEDEINTHLVSTDSRTDGRETAMEQRLARIEQDLAALQAKPAH